jgi:ribosomal protein L31
MKDGIHPKYELQEIHCSCGNVIKTKTTGKNIQVEIFIRSILATRSLWIRQDVSNVSRRDTD